MEQLFLSVAAAVLLGSLAGWLRLAWRRWRGHPPLRWEPRRPVPWSVLDVCFAAGVYLLLQITAGGLVRAAFGVPADLPLEQIPSAARAAALAVGSAATLVAVLVSLAGLFAWHPSTAWRDVGWDRRRVGQDLWIGLAAFVLLAPPVYAVQRLMVTWFPYEHPLITLLVERPDRLYLVLSGFSALLVAPLAEEYFFRVLLQGWLEKLDAGAAWLSSAEAKGLAEAGQTGALAETSGGLPTEASTSRPARLWPALVSAALFGAMHAPHGPAPVPLFVLSAGLGYVYLRTHRLLPCVVAHMLFNASSLAALWLAIRGG